MMFKFLYILIFFIIIRFDNFCQTCGFNCIGITGIYGGYSYQNYKSKAFDEYAAIFIYDTVNFNSKENFSFGLAGGWKIGVNIFKAKFKSFYFGAKTHYQYLIENKNFTYEINNIYLEDRFKVELNYFTFAVDFGIPVFSFVDFKVFETGLTFNTAELENSLYQNGKCLKVDKYVNSARTVNYYLASGIILKLYKDILQIEGSASYNSIKIGAMENEEGEPFISKNTKMPYEKTIDKGGFAVSAQVNINISF